ncbi:hypothetical protein [Bradyrhizobium sp. Bra78]|uniref:hypothetical protein n=1 Tax=Bradyrhizobium sp. Bra78 TaxID=2926010 RepID=UPI0021C72B11|nr:hypothetical protein [Bradyrhizobium sp. Bra78]
MAGSGGGADRSPALNSQLGVAEPTCVANVRSMAEIGVVPLMPMQVSVTASLSRREPGGRIATARIVLNQHTRSSANYADEPFQSRKESGHVAPNHRFTYRIRCHWHSLHRDCFD